MDGANLEGTNLERTDQRDAHPAGTFFAHARLDGTNFEGAVLTMCAGGARD